MQSYVTKLVLTNFGSYRQRTEIPLSPGLNVITGPNGSGKTILLESILFVANQMPRMKSWRESIHEGEIKAEVEMYINTAGDIEYKISRSVTITSSSSIYRINDKTVSLRKVRQLLQQLHIPFDNPLLIIRSNTMIPLLKQIKTEKSPSLAIRQAIEESAGLTTILVNYRQTMDALIEKKNTIQAKEEELATIEHEITVLVEERKKIIYKRELETQLSEMKAQLLVHKYHALLQGKKPKIQQLDAIESQIKETEGSKVERLAKREEVTLSHRTLITRQAVKTTERDNLVTEIANFSRQKQQLFAKLQEIKAREPELDLDNVYQSVKANAVQLTESREKLAKLKKIHDIDAQLVELKTQSQWISEEKIRELNLKTMKEKIPIDFQNYLGHLLTYAHIQQMDTCPNIAAIRHIITEYQEQIAHENMLNDDFITSSAQELQTFFEWINEHYSLLKETYRSLNNAQKILSAQITKYRVKDPVAIYPETVSFIIRMCRELGITPNLPLCAYLKDLSKDGEELIRRLLSSRELYSFFITSEDVLLKLIRYCKTELEKDPTKESEIPLLVFYEDTPQLQNELPLTELVPTDNPSLDNFWQVINNLPPVMRWWIYGRYCKLQIRDSTPKQVLNVKEYFDPKLSVRKVKEDAFTCYQTQGKAKMPFSLADVDKEIERLEKERTINVEQANEVKKYIEELDGDKRLSIYDEFSSRIKIYNVELPQLKELRTKFQQTNEDYNKTLDTIKRLDQEKNTIINLNEMITKLERQHSEYAIAEQLAKDWSIVLSKNAEDTQRLTHIDQEITDITNQITQLESTLKTLEQMEHELYSLLVDLVQKREAHKREIAKDEADILILREQLPPDFDKLTLKTLEELQQVRDQLEKEIASIKIMYIDAETRLASINDDQKKAIAFISQLNLEIKQFTAEAANFEQIWVDKIRDLCPKIESETNLILNEIKHEYRIKLALTNLDETREVSTKDQMLDAIPSKKHERIDNANIRLIVKAAKGKTEIDETMRLSDGQKSLIIITLIFGMQKAAGQGIIYLLDEFDQNLDVSNASKVWVIVKHLAEQTQYLILTPKAKAENIIGANQIIGVYRPNNGASKVFTIAQDSIQKKESVIEQYIDYAKTNDGHQS